MDGLWLVPSTLRVRVIDPAKGFVADYNLRAGVDQIAVTDEHIVLGTYSSPQLLVFDRQEPA